MSYSLIITILFIISLIIIFLLFITKGNKSDDKINFKIDSLDQIENYKEIVDSYIDNFFHETLFYYLNKELTFDENSSVRIQKKFSYRECIRNLIRPDVKLDGNIFKYVFTQRVYLYFISETPKNIKNLIYCFHSGYDINNFWDKKKTKSISNYVIDHVDKMINRYFYEITKYEEEIFNNIDSKNTNEMDVELKHMDADFYSKLCLFIYNLNVIRRDNDLIEEQNTKNINNPEGDKEK